MRSPSLYILFFVALIAICSSKASKATEDQTSLAAAESILGHEENSFLRDKRELENMNDEYPTSDKESEEPSFWDKMLKMLAKAFVRVMEWINSS